MLIVKRFRQWDAGLVRNEKMVEVDGKGSYSISELTLGQLFITV